MVWSLVSFDSATSTDDPYDGVTSVANIVSEMFIGSEGVDSIAEAFLSSMSLSLSLVAILLMMPSVALSLSASLVLVDGGFCRISPTAIPAFGRYRIWCGCNRNSICSPSFKLIAGIRGIFVRSVWGTIYAMPKSRPL